MEELLEEIEHFSYLDDYDIHTKPYKAITLEDLHKILSKYEVVQKSIINQPYTT